MKYVALDIETNGLHPYKHNVLLITLNLGKTIKVYNAVRDGISSELKRICEDQSICKVIHNASFDCTFLRTQMGINCRNIWDTYLCEQVIQGLQIPRSSKDEELRKQHSASLKYTLLRYGFPELKKEIRETFGPGWDGRVNFTKEQIEYAKNDVKYLLELQQAQEYILTRDGMLDVALLENKVVERVSMMRSMGIGFDTNKWLDIARENETKYNQLMKKLPTGINWNSPKQVKEFFFDRGIMIESFDELDKVYAATKNELLLAFIEARSLYKSVTAYGREWLNGTVDTDNRVRAEAEQILNTGRFSMSNPNLQQLPANGKHRSAFIPRKGHVFVIGDFSGQEIGIMAAAAQEEIWIEALLRGDDIHSLVASMLYEEQWESGREKGCTFPGKCKCKVHGKLRGEAKVLNFMLAYGGGPQKFAEKTGLPQLEARVVVNRYKRIIPKLTRWLEKNGRDASIHGVSFSADKYARRRVLRGEEEWQIVNQGKNNPIQSAGANMLKLAMISIPEQYSIVLVIHDEIVLEVKKIKANKAMKILKEVMEQSADYITGIKGLIKVQPRIATDLTKD